jgi:flagellar hook-associated protein 1 FlgK
MEADAGSKSAGNGVQIGSLLRFSDSYKTQQMWRANSELGAHSQTQPYLTQLEKVMSDDKSSISYGVDNFFKALNAAGVDPTSSPLRQAVITAADSMSQQINSIYTLTANQLVSVRQQSEAILPSLNQSLANIAALNQQITSVGAGGTSTSELIDKREIADRRCRLAGRRRGHHQSRRHGQRVAQERPAAGDRQHLRDDVLRHRCERRVDLDGNFGKTKYPLDDTKVSGQLGGLADSRKTR